MQTASKKRIATLDVLRGIALLGILLVTLPKFALPDRFLETILQNPGSIDFNAAFFVKVGFEGKMRAIFSMIFGAGIILFVSDKEKSGVSVSRIFYSRMFWLAMFGLFHAHVLLSSNDILYPYALCGMILFFFRNLRPVLLVGAVLAITLFEMGFYTYYYNRARSEHLAYLQVRKLEQQGVPLTEMQRKTKARGIESESENHLDQEKIGKNIELMGSDYWAIAEHKRADMIVRQTRHVPHQILDSIGLMFLGMALFKWGFFAGDLKKKTYLLSMIICYGVGIPLALYSWNDSVKFPDPVQFMETHPYNTGIYIYSIQRILIALGHVSAIILFIRSGLFDKLLGALGAVGRMAFTNYILQTVICTLIFYGYGFGFFAKFEYHALCFIVVAIWLVQIVGSSLWLRYFRFGPLEWAWRSLTYWKRQSMAIPRHSASPLQSAGQ